MRDSGWDIAAAALAKGRAGGTMAFTNIGWLTTQRDAGQYLTRARTEQGWDIHAIERMDDLIGFAQAFSRRRYHDEHKRAAP